MLWCFMNIVRMENLVWDAAKSSTSTFWTILKFKFIQLTLNLLLLFSSRLLPCNIFLLLLHEIILLDLMLLSYHTVALRLRKFSFGWLLLNIVMTSHIDCRRAILESLGQILAFGSHSCHRTTDHSQWALGPIIFYLILYATASRVISNRRRVILKQGSDLVCLVVWTV